MSFAANVINELAESILEKEKCNDCLKPCQNDCISCLDYYDGKIPDYSCNNLRTAYVLRYLYVHKAEIKKLLSDSSDFIIEHLGLENKQNEFVCAGVGTGPGSDLVGIIEWLSFEGIRDLDMKFIRIDKEENWVNQYNVIRDSYAPLIDQHNLKIDFRKKINSIFQINLKQSSEIELVTFSYIISEIATGKDYEEKLYRIWRRFKNALADKSIIVFNDRPQKGMAQRFDFLKSIICQEYPKSFVRNCSFDGFYGKKHNYNHCEDSYPDELRGRFKAKLWCTSWQSIIFIDKDE